MGLTRAKKSHNEEIEFLRFVFALMVVVFHANKLLPADKHILGHGALAVEFFFLLSGYLMMASVQRRKENPLSVSAFAFNKIKGFWAELVASVALSVGIFACAGGGATTFVKDLLNTLVSSVLLLRMTGMTYSVHDMNNPTWYLSSLLIGICITYPLLRRFGTHVLLCVLAVGICGYLQKENGMIANAMKWTHFTYAGNLRGIAELLLGAFAWQAAAWLKTQRLSGIARAGLTAIKWLGIAFVFGIAQVKGYSWDGACLLALWCSLVIAFSCQGVDSAWYRNKFCVFLGSLSLPLFLAHNAWIRYMVCRMDVAEMSVLEILLIMGGLSGISAFITMGLAKLLRRFAGRICRSVILQK